MSNDNDADMNALRNHAAEIDIVKNKAAAKDASKKDASAKDGDRLEVCMEEEVRQAEMESRLRRMITEVLKPSIVKVTRLQTDHEIMWLKFQEMIDSHQEVVSAQKEAKEHSEVVGVFKQKLTEFWVFNNQLEDKINNYQKAAVQRMEELEHTCEINKSTSTRIGRNLDRALQDMDRMNANIKATQVSLEKGIQKNKERMDMEVRNMHILVGEVRAVHDKLEIEVWGPEDCSDISPPCLRKLDMQMRKQTSLLSEAVEDITALQKLDGELMEITKRASASEGHLAHLQSTTNALTDRVEVCAQEAKADFKQASNLMAAFSANLVREARHSFKDELKHAQQMQKEVDDFVSRTQAAVVESDEFVKSLGRQIEAMVAEVRFDLDSFDEKRHRDKQSIEDTVRSLQQRVAIACDSSDNMLRGLEHVSSVVGMSLQSERMSVTLDQQEYVERKEIAYVGVRESPVETVRLRALRAEKGIRQPGLDPEALHRILYNPQPVHYQGTAFERAQLLALREKLVHVAQEVLQQGPELKAKTAWSGADPAQDLFMAMPAQRIPSGEHTRSSTPARPGSRGQPGARGSTPLQEGTEPRESPSGPRESPSEHSDDKSSKASKSVAASPDVDGNQLPALTGPATKQRKPNGSRSPILDTIQAPLSAR